MRWKIKMVEKINGTYLETRTYTTEVAKKPTHWAIACQGIGRFWRDRSTWLNWMSFRKIWLVAADDTYSYTLSSPLSSLLGTFLFIFRIWCELVDRKPTKFAIVSELYGAFILSDLAAVPSSRARFAFSKEQLFRAFEASFNLSRTWNSIDVEKTDLIAWLMDESNTVHHLLLRPWSEMLELC